MKNNLKKTLFLSMGVATAYAFLKGEGIFNKPRFYREHKAIEKYLNAYYTNAQFSNLVKIGDGHSCVVETPEKKFMLKIHKTEDGVFLFSETDL